MHIGPAAKAYVHSGNPNHKPIYLIPVYNTHIFCIASPTVIFQIDHLKNAASPYNLDVTIFMVELSILQYRLQKDHQMLKEAVDV
jgi:K+ transporter